MPDRYLPKPKSYSVFVDFENLWILNQAEALPGSNPSQEIRELLPDIETANKVYTQAGKFPSILKEIIMEKCGGIEPRSFLAVADWDGVFIMPKKVKIDKVFADLKITKAKHCPLKSKDKKDKKDASDIELLLYLIRDVGWETTKDDLIIIGSSDHFFARFAYMHLKYNRNDVHFCFVILMEGFSPLIIKLKEKFPQQVSLIVLDHQEMYKIYHKECGVVDPIRTVRYDTPIQNRIINTTIAKITYAETKPDGMAYEVSQYNFRNWVRGWLYKYDQSKGVDKDAYPYDEKLDNRTDIIVSTLVKDGIIKEIPPAYRDGVKGKRKYPPCITLNIDSNEVKEKVDELNKIGSNRFELKYFTF